MSDQVLVEEFGMGPKQEVFLMRNKNSSLAILVFPNKNIHQTSPRQ